MIDLGFKTVNKKECYDILLSWWESHNAFEGNIIEYKTLPELTCFVSVDGVDVYALPVYQSDSDFCFLGWLTSNPNYSYKKSLKKYALKQLFNYVSEVFKKKGYDKVLSKTGGTTGLKNALEESGFQFVETTNFHIKKI